ncbi:MAG: HPr family phosphocarrier protein [Oscillospiraceae bacterium]
MVKFTYTIKDEAGIHARPAGMLVKLLQTFACQITITKDEKTIDGKRLFSLMGLAVKQGETITFAATGEDEQQAADQALSFMQQNM